MISRTRYNQNLNNPQFISKLLYLYPLGIILVIGVLILLKNIIPKHHTIAKTQMQNNAKAAILDKIDQLVKPSLDIPNIPTNKPNILARSYTIIDSKTKYPLASKNADTPVAIASTTKIMTALVALDIYKLDTVLTIPKEAATVTGSEIQLIIGENMTVNSLLHALLISSANDSAYALALGQGLKKEDFVAKMNNKATLLGLTKTHYKDPAGLDDEGHSTPHDLALLTDYALNNPSFSNIVSIPTYTIWSADKKYKHDLKNSNRLVQTEDPLFYPNAIGVKTGFTYEAGHCLIAAALYPDGRRNIAVVLHTNYESKEASAYEARKLLSWANKQ